MKNWNTVRSLIVYMVAHFMVDFTCFYFLMGTFTLYQYTGIGVAKGFLLYNGIAFGTQFLLGWYFDGREYRYAGMLGMALLMIGIGLDTMLPMLAADSLVIEFESILGIPYKHWLVITLVLMALGNSLFHVAGGMDSLVHAKGKSRRCGIFVSSGALGVAMGSYAGGKALFDGMFLIGALFVGCVLIGVYGGAESKEYQKEKNRQMENPELLLPAVLCFLAIAIRGYVGTLMKSSFSVLFLAAIATCFGKAIGGFLADEFGGKYTGLFSLLAAAICFSGVLHGDLVTITAIVCFNIAMPITYYTLYHCFIAHPGLACGLNTLGLLAGVCISYTGYVPSEHKTAVLVTVTMISAILIFLSAPEKEQVEKHQQLESRKEIKLS